MLAADNSTCRFVLVVPALNEQEAIAAILRRALAQREKVLAETPATEMSVVFVNDGCTDKTQSIADHEEFREVVKVEFDKNRGYGAAIKAGWRACEGELVGFIDADGTCDPDDCVRLINCLMQNQADVVIASRVNPKSEMPMVRKIGNWLFARLLGAVSGNSVSDAASGFRVVRRASLNLLTPLPDGLHFTPAMSSICMLDPRLRIEEVPIPYKERIGQSKLSVLRDGFRFLYTILFSACIYAPIKVMFITSCVAAVACAAAVTMTVISGASNAMAVLIGLTGMISIGLLLWTGVIVHQLNFLLIGPRQHITPAESLLQKMLHYKRLIAAGAATSVVSCVALLAIGLRRPLSGSTNTLATTGLALATVGGIAVVAAGVIIRVIWAVGQKKRALIRDEYSVIGPEQASRVSRKQQKNKPVAIGEPAATAE